MPLKLTKNLYCRAPTDERQRTSISVCLCRIKNAWVQRVLSVVCLRGESVHGNGRRNEKSLRHFQDSFWSTIQFNVQGVPKYCYKLHETDLSVEYIRRWSRIIFYSKHDSFTKYLLCCFSITNYGLYFKTQLFWNSMCFCTQIITYFCSLRSVISYYLIYAYG